MINIGLEFLGRAIRQKKDKGYKKERKKADDMLCLHIHNGRLWYIYTIEYYSALKKN
jgi:hypothetical protein